MLLKIYVYNYKGLPPCPGVARSFFSPGVLKVVHWAGYPDFYWGACHQPSDYPFSVSSDGISCTVSLLTCILPLGPWSFIVLSRFSCVRLFANLWTVAHQAPLSMGFLGLVLKLKLQNFGHLMRRSDSFEKTLMLGKIEGGWRRG